MGDTVPVGGAPVIICAPGGYLPPDSSTQSPINYNAETVVSLRFRERLSSRCRCRDGTRQMLQGHILMKENYSLSQIN